MTYAIDTNILSYILNGNAVVSTKLESVVGSSNTVVIPLIVYYESRRGLLAKGATAKIRAFDSLISRIGVLDLTMCDMDTAAVIYANQKRSGYITDDADLLIAAQCVTHGFTLVTANTRHFKHIERLQIVNWALEEL